MRSVLAAAVALAILGVTGAGAVASAQPLTEPPEIRPFETAHFGLIGTVKVDGVSIDVLGEGDLAPPDRQRASFKFGPFTAEVIMIGDAVYTRTRFERRWSRQFNTQPTVVGPFSSADISKLQGDVRRVGSEVVGGVPTEHYTASLDFLTFVEPILGAVDDQETREAFKTLTGTVDVWVGLEDRMIRQERLVLSVTLPAIEPEGDPVPATVDLTIAYAALNQPVSIVEPTRNDPSPLRTPRPNVAPVGGPSVGPAPAPAQPRLPAPAPAPAQVPRR